MLLHKPEEDSIMKIHTFLKIFDRELIEILLLNSVGIAFLLIHFYAYSIEMALLMAPIASLSAFLGIIGFVHLFSVTMNLFEKGISIFR